MNERWDLRFLQEALTISKRSKDPSSKIGCVLVNPLHRFSFMNGYNGFPPGVSDSLERLSDRETKLSLMVHSEMAAIAKAARVGFATDGAYIYVTRFPCSSCFGVLAVAGIKRLVYIKNIDFESRWKSDAVRIVSEEAGIELRGYEEEDVLNAS